MYTDKFILTPGPTEIPHRVKQALARETTNPDLDPEFIDYYREVVAKLKKLLGAEKTDTYILLGEAILGLEAAIANLVKEGDKVLVVANGVYGEGFADFVKMYQGEPVLLEADWRKPVDPSELDRALEKNKDTKLVTIVHCDTPSAILNPLEEVAKIANNHGVLLVSDSVSAIGGVPVEVDKWGVDILIGGSQKALNLPPGLTIVTISSRAWEEINKTNYQGYYLNLKTWKEMLDQKQVFPYTMSDTLIYALDEALNILFEEGLENVYKRHNQARKASWSALEAANLEPYPLEIEYSSPTVTAIQVPRGVDEKQLRETTWKKYGVMIAGSWGRLEGKIIRIGHMGVQASRTHLLIAYTALAKALRQQGYKVDIGKVVEAVEETYH